MATDITSWVPKIAPSVPYCPDPVIEEYTVDVLRDFCHFTRLWDENELAAIDIEDGEADYTLTSSDGDIVCVDSVEVDGIPIRPISIDDLNKRRLLWRDLESSRSTMYIFGMTDSIKLVYTPNEAIASGLVVWVCLKPLETATTVETFLWNEFKDVITKGVIARLMGVASRPWSNPQESVRQQELYEADRFTAFNLKQTGRTRLELKATPVFFA